MQVRTEQLEDIEAIYNVNIAAFGRDNEADLVDRLRGLTSTLSFVAVAADRIVGHIFYSPVTIVGACAKDLLILGLAPLAVLPEYQRQGVGSLLIQHSLKECTRLGIQAIVVLGHPTYYPRFGFTPAQEKGLKCEYAVPDEAFMVLELDRGALNGCFGTIAYRSEFRECE
jgi:putative acetyltransferase